MEGERPRLSQPPIPQAGAGRKGAGAGVSRCYRAAARACAIHPSNVAWCTRIHPSVWRVTSCMLFAPSLMRRFCALMSLIGSFITSNKRPAAGFLSMKARLATMRCSLARKP
ncbi:hypothetical protein D9M69_674410 [compost metagenome]